MSDEILIDKMPNAPHPREVFEFFGNHECEVTLSNALDEARFHHAWIFCGPKGVGKATLAYRLARRYLGAKRANSSPLASESTDEICTQISAGSHNDLRVATRYCPDKERISNVVTVEAIRELIKMFDLKANNPLGRKVAIVDCADDMNVNSSNALLKTLEEPPAGGLLILITNSLGAILPTIRSRCRVLRLQPLANDIMRQALPQIDDAALSLANGSIGRAKALIEYDVGGLYRLLTLHLGGLPNAPQKPALDLANRAKDIETFNLIIDLVKDWLLRTAKAGLGVQISEVEVGESATLARLATMQDSRKIAQSLAAIEKLRSAADNNLDKPSLVLEALIHAKSALL